MRDQLGPPEDRSALIIDPSVVGQSHLLVNTGFIRLVLGRYPRVTIIAEKTHCDALARYLGAEAGDRVEFVPWSRKSDIRRTIRAFIAGRRFDQILFTNMEYGLFVYMSLFHRKASRRPTLWVIHSHLANALKPGKAARIKNLIKWYVLFRLFRNVRFVVLGQRIKRNVEALIGPFFQRDNVAAIFHPIGIAKLPENGSGRAPRLPRVFFMSGWHALSPENRALLDALDRIPPEARHFEIAAQANRFGEANKQKSFAMEYMDRLGLIAEADFFLHLPSDPYRLQASGAVMDMLLTGTPMIGLRTDFGEELTGIIGPFGYFFDNRNDLLRFLSSKGPDPVEVRAFRANLNAGYDTILALSRAQFDEVLASDRAAARPV